MVNITKIYLEGKYDDDCLLVNVDTVMVLFVLECCEDLDVEIVFTTQYKKKCSLLKLRKELNYNNVYMEIKECPLMIQNCILPALKIENENLVVVGLSATLRHALKSKAENDSSHISNKLLGFRKGCLQACAEVSIWTKFCEVEIIDMVNQLYFNINPEALKELTFPIHIIRYEKHLEKPPILHNALKRKQEHLQNIVSEKSLLLEMKKLKLNQLPDLEHIYAEGIDFTLADILLYVSFSLCYNRLKLIIEFENISPLVLRWYTQLNKFEIIRETEKSLLECVFEHHPSFLQTNDLKIIYADVPDESLYKNDPNRYKPRWRSFTHQKDIIMVTNILKEISFKEIRGGNLLFTNEKNEIKKSSEFNEINHLKFEKKLDWDSFPSEVIPLDGDLPLSRLKRKCQQLESLAQIVISLSKDGDKIVDFCSGGGHLGILLAYCLPKCKLLLVENKKNSLDKAVKRVEKLNLENVEFYQCNLDYFDGEFDIGVCLHACGVATDLIIQKCCRQLSQFVCSPCCYGSIRPNHILTYPRSLLYKEKLNISPSEFLILGHAADQTHDKDNPKTEQGKKCMKYVDFDRLSGAQEIGYKTYLCVMDPPECTPKNHILVGKNYQFPFQVQFS